MRSRIAALTVPIRCAGDKYLDFATPRNAFNSFDRSRKMRKKPFPYSCTDEEGMLLYLTIIANRLSSGFEISTAFGYSSAYIASALKETGGRLTSMDCYVEESKESADYTWDGQWDTLITATEKCKSLIAQGKFPDGLALANTLAQELDYSANVSFQVGVSPHDVAGYLSQELDFVFIDGGHYGEQPTLDFNAIKSSLASKCAVFFHDNFGNVSIAKAVAACADHLGSQPIVLPTLWHLTLVERNLDSTFLKQLTSFCLWQSHRRRQLSRLFSGALKRLGFEAFS